MDTPEIDEGQEVEQVSLSEDIESNFDELETPDEPVEEPVKTETIEEEALQSPTMWGKEYRDTFDSWGGLEHGRDYQQSMLDLYGTTQAHVTKVEQEAVNYRNESEAWGGVFQPHQEFLMHNGLTPQDAARRGVGIMANIASDPQAFALDILKRSNYDFSTHGQDAPYIPPEVAAMQTEINSLKQTQQNNVLQGQNNERANLNQHIQSFVNAKDASGNQLYPHYNAVESDMAGIVYGLRGRGLPIPPLPELYETACKQNPDIQAQVKANEVATDTARKASDAKKAKAASKRPTGQPSGKEKTSSNIKDDISAEYDKLAAAG